MTVDDTGGNVLLRSLPVINKRGLHARASTRFVKCVAEYDAVVHVAKDGVSVSGGSIMGLMLLAAAPGSTIDISAQGPDAMAVLDALEALLADRFGEGE